MFDIHQLMRSLGNARPVFHSELDFHFQFAWLIKQTYPTSCIVPVYKPQRGVREYLDIFVDLGSVAIMVELKYKTVSHAAIAAPRGMKMEELCPRTSKSFRRFLATVVPSVGSRIRETV